MKKSDLKTGMVLETRNGEKYLVMLNPDCKDMELINFKGGYMPLYYYNNELIFTEKPAEKPAREFDVVKVYSAGWTIRDLLSDKEHMKFKLIWERNEPKEMTISEIEKELGYKIKIVGDDNA